MCGITGVLNFDGRPVSRSVIDRMTKRLLHRGPDAVGIWIGDQIGLGHTRLKIIDLSPAASQPMGNEDDSLRLVFNGEVYNYRELSATLKRMGHQFRSRSDTEVVLHLYEEEGDRCIEELDGMFAFALWDDRRRRILLARDRVGKKPLYYTANRGMLAFASEIKALLAHPLIPTDPDPSAIPSYLLYGFVPTPASFYRGIVSLSPGHTLTIGDNGTPETRRYWKLSFNENGLPRSGPAEDNLAARKVRQLVTEAVRKRLVADVPLGAFLSGGLDSSVVVGVMSRLMTEPVKTFSIGFADDPAFDETRYARMVAKHFGTDHTEFVVRPKAIDLLETLIWHYDGPFGDPSAIPTFIVSRLAREHVTVALSGDGGDEQFAGYLRFVGALLSERIPVTCMRWGNRVLSWFPEPRNYHSPIRRAQRFFQSAGIPFHERYSRWISLFYDDLEQLLHPQFLASARPVDRIGYFREHLPAIDGWSLLAQLLYLNFKTYLVDDLLVKADRSSMANGLEVRSPLLDRELTEYCGALPDRMKLRRGSHKYILKRAFADLLPPAILKRGKMGFGVPLGAWFRTELKEFVEDMFFAPDARIREYLNIAYVRELVRVHTTGVQDHGHRLWAILALELWLRLLPEWTSGASQIFRSTPTDLEGIDAAFSRYPPA